MNGDLKVDVSQMVRQLRAGEKLEFPATASHQHYAESLDANPSLINFRDEFLVPTKNQLERTSVRDIADDHSTESSPRCIYFCGNSLGLQPKAVSKYLQAYLRTWSSIAVKGHFNALADSPLVAYQDMAADVGAKMADIVGANPPEVIAMNTLSANLHFMMAAFYKPTEHKHKILLEWRPFPSDYYAIESQIEWHGRNPKDSMLLIGPDEGSHIISTSRILSLIDQNKNELALVLLPGLQYYNGQLLDIPKITAHAQSYGITVGWDLAHAAGNVELKLHDWNVDFACWCTYKYMNAGAGAIAGAFVHERHGSVVRNEESGKLEYHPRLKGWYGGDKSVRFLMDNNFVPSPGASGFQLSNPSIVDLTCLSATLSVFNKTSMEAIRSKSLLLTSYAQFLLEQILERSSKSDAPFRIITPLDPLERGAQLSVLLRPGLLDQVGQDLEAAGVICDKRKPDVLRIAPAPLYNTFGEIWHFMQIFGGAIQGAG